METYPHIWVFSVADMRNSYLKEVRAQWKGARQGRIFFGRNRPIAKALGKTEEEELKPGLHKLSEHLRGDVGLFFTAAPEEEVREYFGQYHQADYARSGVRATQTVELPMGRVMRGDEAMPPNMFDSLRKLGMPVTKQVGQIMLDAPYTVCREGDVLTPNQAHLLKLFYYQLADFSIQLLHHYHDGQCEEVMG